MGKWVTPHIREIVACDFVRTDQTDQTGQKNENFLADSNHIITHSQSQAQLRTSLPTSYLFAFHVDRLTLA